MPNVMTVLKAEISRIARKEAKQAVAPLRKPTTGARRTFADLKRRLAAVEKEIKRLAALLAKMPPPAATPGAGDQKARITGKGMRSLRRKLRLSGEQLGQLLGVSGPAVYAWEKRNGPLRVRQSTRTAILSIRNLGAREARKRLQALAKK